MTAALRLTSADWMAVEREYCRRRLVNFVRAGWHVLEPADEFVDNWHIGAICEHLEAVTSGQINRLLINVPPGCMKSLLACVFWNAWVWGPRGMPHTKWLTASHSETYALRDSRRTRNLILSDWYQQRWPTRLAKDQNATGKYENQAMGFRRATPVASMTGDRGHFVVWDDPHSVEMANSPAELVTTGRVFHETLPSRLVNPRESAIVIIMQRLALGDVSGLAISEDLGYEHLMLPMEFEPKRKCVTSIGFEDPRKKDGELLFPGRFPADVVERDKKAVGAYATAGQLQQRPAPRGGGMFKVNRIVRRRQPPPESQVVGRVRYWDKAGTQDGGAYTAGVLMSRIRTPDGERYVIEHVKRGQWSAGARETNMRTCAEDDGHQVYIWIEQEPGSGGKESAMRTISNLSGFSVRADRVTGDKVDRADPLSAAIEAGIVEAVVGEWTQDLLDEMEVFPRGRYKDQCDAAAGAFNKVAALVNQSDDDIGDAELVQ